MIRHRIETKFDETVLYSYGKGEPWEWSYDCDVNYIVCLTDVDRPDFNGGGTKHVKAVLAECDSKGNVFENGDVIELSEDGVTAFAWDYVPGCPENELDNVVPGLIEGNATIWTSPVKSPQNYRKHWTIAPQVAENPQVGQIVHRSTEKSEGYFEPSRKDDPAIDKKTGRIGNKSLFLYTLDADPVVKLTNDNGEEITTENFDEWESSFKKLVYDPHLEWGRKWYLKQSEK